MSSSLNENSVSGIYTCSCGNLETHIKGKSKAPCSRILCGKNNSWTLIVKTEELEESLKYPSLYPVNDLVVNMKTRFANK